MALRLVSRQWNEASTPLVFDHVHLRLYSNSLRKFDELCHSTLAKYVKAVDFHPHLLPVWDKDKWLPNVDQRPPQHWRQGREEYDKLPRHNLTTEEIDVGWTAYETHVSNQ